MASVIAYLGLGSNLGQREDNLTQAVFLLGENADIQIELSSSLYETAPWGFLDQPHFLNSALEIQTTLSPTALLETTQSVERQVGRKPGVRFGPRVLDIDILLYGQERIALTQPDLEIPHPRIPLRAFVLVPLAELAPNLILPGTDQSISRIRDSVEGLEGVKLWAPPSVF